MSTQQLTKTMEKRKDHKQRLPDGNLVEFLASPDEAGAEICLIRATMPPGTPSRFTVTQTWNCFMFLRARSNPSSPETAFRDGRPSEWEMSSPYQETRNTRCVIVHRFRLLWL